MLFALSQRVYVCCPKGIHCQINWNLSPSHKSKTKSKLRLIESIMSIHVGYGNLFVRDETCRVPDQNIHPQG